MYTVFDPHFLGLSGKITDYLDLVVKYRIGGVGIASELLDDEAAALDTAKRIWDLGLRWNVMFTPVDFYSPKTDDEAFDLGIETLKRRCDVAEKIGVEYSYNHVWSSSEREYAQNFEWHIRRLKRVQRVFMDHGIRYGLEFLGPRDVLYRYQHEFIHTITGVMALAEAAGGFAGFLFDTYHWYCEGARFDDLFFAAEHIDKMIGFHINDGVAGRAREEQKDLERAMPMTTGIIDSSIPYMLFEKKGYTGPVVCEPLNPSISKFKDMSPEECVIELSEAYKRTAKGISQ